MRALLEECIALFRGLKDRWGLSAALALAAAVALEAAEYAEARPLLDGHLRLVEQMGMRRSAPWVLRCLARLAVDQQEWTRAARLLGAGGGLQFAPADRPPPPPIVEADADPVLSLKEVQAVMAVRQALEPEVFAAAWSEGWAMSLEQASKYALADTDAYVRMETGI